MHTQLHIRKLVAIKMVHDIYYESCPEYAQKCTRCH